MRMAKRKGKKRVELSCFLVLTINEKKKKKSGEERKKRKNSGD